MFVWTEKAENDFRKKYPHRKNERKAGTPAMWDGRELKAGTILDGYYDRGWVCDADIVVKPVVKKHKKKPTGHELSNKEKRQRWGKLIYYFSQPNKYSIGEVAKKLGYNSYTVINDFVLKYGEELAAKYGKLPHVNGVKKDYWFKVMEAGQ